MVHFDWYILLLSGHKHLVSCSFLISAIYHKSLLVIMKWHSVVFITILNSVLIYLNLFILHSFTHSWWMKRGIHAFSQDTLFQGKFCPTLEYCAEVGLLPALGGNSLIRISNSDCRFIFPESQYITRFYISGKSNWLAS